MKEKQDINVTKRWILYILINLNIVSIIFLSVFAVVALYYGIYCFEGSTVINNLFYKSKTIGNFSQIPSGSIIDLCTSDIGGDIDTYFNFSKYYTFYDNLINQGIDIRDRYSLTPSSQEYEKFYSKVGLLNLTFFEAVENRKIKWDLDGEQINYFLYPLSSYKYFDPRTFTLI
jgi:hypothetical protein